MTATFRRTGFNGITQEEINAIVNRPRKDFAADETGYRGPGISRLMRRGTGGLGFHALRPTTRDLVSLTLRR